MTPKTPTTSPKTELQPGNFTSLLDFGKPAQQNIANYSNYLSDEIAKISDANLKAHLGDLLTLLSSINLKPYTPKRFLFWTLKPKKPSLEQKTHLQKLLIKLDYIGQRLTQANTALFQEIARLDRFHTENSRYEQAITHFIQVGKTRHKELSNLKHPDPDIQKEHEHYLELLDQRIYDLEMSQAVATQKGLQIRILQDGFQKLAQKIQSSILTTIPIWQDQVSLMLIIEQQSDLATVIGDVLRGQKEILAALEGTIRERG